MNRPVRTVAILVGQHIAQPPIRQAIITASNTTRRIFPQAFHLIEDIIGPFNAHLVQKFPLEPELDPPHVSRLIPSIVTPEIIEPGLARLLLDLQCLVVNAARNGTLALSKSQT